METDVPDPANVQPFDGSLYPSHSAGGENGDPCRGVVGLLSPRQQDVYHWICEGKRDREIATILGISYRTVTVHVRAILSRLGAENRTCAAMMTARLKSSPLNAQLEEGDAGDLSVDS